MRKNTTTLRYLLTNKLLIRRIEALRKKYKHFDKSLNISKSYNSKSLLKAYLVEVNKGTVVFDGDIDIPKEYLVKDASIINHFLKSLINIKKTDRSIFFIHTTSQIFNTKKWAEIDIKHKRFEDLLLSITPSSFMISPIEEIEFVFNNSVINTEEKEQFIEYIILKTVYILTQNTKSPPIYKLIEEGIFNNEPFIKKSTFNRLKNKIGKDVDASCVFKAFKNNIDDFIINSINYYLDNYKSAHLLRTENNHVLAIDIPFYKDINYNQITASANSILKDTRTSNTTSSISQEKVILFIYLMVAFNVQRRKGRSIINYTMPTSRFTIYFGDKKVVRAIRDALEENKLVILTKKAIPEVCSNEYLLNTNLVESGLYPLRNPFLIMKINGERTGKIGYTIENKIEFVSEVGAIIFELEKNKSSNITKLFLETYEVSHIHNLLELLVALKNVLFNTVDRTNKYFDAISLIEYKQIEKLFPKLYSFITVAISKFAVGEETKHFIPNLWIDSLDDLKNFNNSLLKKFNIK